jgi:hypothetical protein
MPETKAFDPETAPLEELRAMALAESEKAEVAEPEVRPAAKAEVVIADDPDHLVIPTDEAEEVAEEEEETEYIVRREIDLGDGSGVQVFSGKGATQAEAYEAYIDKINAAQASATRKIRELSKQVKTEKVLTDQEKADIEYVTRQRFQKEPEKVVEELVIQTLNKAAAGKARSDQAQTDFVATHPLFVTDPKTGNGDKMLAEFARLYPDATEFTEAGLEKAYQSLSSSGLLVLRSEEADAATEAEVKATERIAQPKTEATQPRVSRKASTVSPRGRPAPVVKTEPTEDELYAMPMDKLRRLAIDADNKAQE